MVQGTLKGKHLSHTVNNLYLVLECILELTCFKDARVNERYHLSGLRGKVSDLLHTSLSVGKVMNLSYFSEFSAGLYLE